MPTLRRIVQARSSHVIPIQDRAGVPRKVVWPSVSVRMKERDLFVCVWIDCDRAIRLVPIESWARKANVLEDRFTASRAWQDMLEFKDGDCQFFGGVAISTTVCKMVSDLTLQIDRNINAHTPVAPAC